MFTISLEPDSDAESECADGAEPAAQEFEEVPTYRDGRNLTRCSRCNLFAGPPAACFGALERRSPRTFSI